MTDIIQIDKISKQAPATGFTLRLDKNGEYTLLRNKVPQVCPWFSDIPMQGNMGRLELVKKPCTSACPMMVIGVMPDNWDNGGRVRFCLECKRTADSEVYFADVEIAEGTKVNLSI